MSEDLATKLQNIESEMREHYRQYRLCEKKMCKLRDKIQKECAPHQWERDDSVYDHHTHWECRKCGAYR